ncbi:MAG TPA: PAS domain S-box protein, partial [Oligoflexia bacterium]|nr:PAS domain S-box protein [Oligoflexia bacterium]
MTTDSAPQTGGKGCAGRLLGWFSAREGDFCSEFAIVVREARDFDEELVVFCSEPRAQVLKELLRGQDIGLSRLSMICLDVLSGPVLAGGAELHGADPLRVIGDMAHNSNQRICAVVDLAGDSGSGPEVPLVSHRLRKFCREQRITLAVHWNLAEIAAFSLFEALPLFDSILVDGRFLDESRHDEMPANGHRPQLVHLISHLFRTTDDKENIEETARYAPQVLGSDGTEQLFAAIIDSMGDGIFVTDEKGRMILCNKQAQQLLGYGFLDLPLAERVRKIGNFMPDMITPYPVEDLPISKAIQGECSDEAEIFIRNEKKPDGVWVSSTGRPLRDESGHVRGGVVVFRDITAHKKQIQKNLLLEARMSQRQKLEGLGLLAGGIAHDFNNLLMGVVGNAGLALLECPPDSMLQGRLEQIKTGALRLAELTNQLLAYSGRGSFSEEPVNVSELVREMQGLLERVVSKKAQVKSAFADGLPLVKADATQLRQIVMNLITNASDALGEDAGEITISTGVMFADREY